MYQSQEFRRYAREAIMKPAINDILKKRQVIIDVEYEDAIKVLSESN